ncbi:MAG: HU family DNA-binding protein [Candidatus Fermentibacteraceae bacterium]|nr:HU family DNA-binding protein [Candidatus Fermentibacteraceae bacterium]
MTREELARETAGRTGLTIREVQSVIVTFLDVIRETLCRGESVFLRGFGSFSTKKGSARRVRDPRNDGIMVIPARFRPVFRPYPLLRDAVQNSLAPRTRVAFFCIGYPDAKSVSITGSFNSWDETGSLMQKLPDGSWFAELVMSSGQAISYSFMVDGVRRQDPAYPSGTTGVSKRQV